MVMKVNSKKMSVGVIYIHFRPITFHGVVPCK